MKLNFILFIFCLGILSCAEEENPVVSTSIIINIQPFRDATSEQISFIYLKLYEIYPKIRIKKAIDIPSSAYYKPRDRYRADSIIRYLNIKTLNNHVTIGITNKDISVTKGNIRDYGLMGLGFCPGKACVVSSFRLSKKNTMNQLFKIAIHELGHTQGLTHCQVKNCFMRDAEGKNHTDEITTFCKTCKVQLIKKGWILK